MKTETISSQTIYKKQILNPKELLLYIESKWKSLITLLILVMMCCIGCVTTTKPPENNLTSLLASTIPPFPKPSPQVADELSNVCPPHKCEALFSWLGELKKLEKKLKLIDKEYE